MDNNQQFVSPDNLLDILSPIVTKLKENENVSTLSSHDLVKYLGAGWNLGNSLDSWDGETHTPELTPEEWESSWHNPVTTKKMIHAVKQKGFNTIRIPITWRVHLDENKIIKEEWFKRVETVVNWVLDEDMFCIINVHHDTGKEGILNADLANIDSMKEYLTNLWSQIGTRFANYSSKLIFESFNEILNITLDDVWKGNKDGYTATNILNQTFVNTVRKQQGNEQRFLICPTYGAQASTDVLNAYKVPIDTVKDKIIAEVHSYNATYDTINTLLDSLKRAFVNKNIPLLIGEFGTKKEDASDGTGMTLSDRITITRQYVSLARKSGIPVIVWDNGVGNYGLLNRKSDDMSWNFEEIPDLIVKLSDTLWTTGYMYLDDIDLSLIENYKNGSYNYQSGEYNASKTGYICTEFILPKYISYAISTTDKNLRIQVNQIDTNGNNISTSTGSNGSSIEISDKCMYIIISLYHKTVTDLSISNASQYLNYTITPNTDEVHKIKDIVSCECEKIDFDLSIKDFGETQIKLNDNIIPLAINGTAQLEVTGNEDINTIVYSSKNEDIATVSEYGVITKIAEGEATILVIVNESTTIECKVVDLLTSYSEVLNLLNIPYIRSKGITGKGIKVALIESFIKNTDEIKINGWYDAINEKYYSSQPSSITGAATTNHSYHMASLIKGLKRGVATECEFYNCILAGNIDYNVGLERCINWCIENDIRVINLSIASPDERNMEGFYPLFKKAYEHGIIIVKAIGNYDDTEKEVSDLNGNCMCGYSLNMGACQKTGEHNPNTGIGRAMMFCNYGYAGLPTWNPSSKYNATTDKTSASTALTTGIVALILQQDPSLTPRQVYHIIKDNVVQNSSYTQGEWNDHYGWGRITTVPLLDKIQYLSDDEYKEIDSKVEIKDFYLANETNSSGKYKATVGETFSCMPLISPVEKDLYNYRVFILDESKAHYYNNVEDTMNVIVPDEAGTLELLIVAKEIGLSKKIEIEVEEED